MPGRHRSGPGRPPVDDDLRLVNLTVKVSPSDRAWLLLEARKAGQNLSEFVRSLFAEKKGNKNAAETDSDGISAV